MKEYLKTVDEVIEENGSSYDGLTARTAKGILERKGKNKLAEGEKTSLFARFLTKLADPMIIILIVAALVSAITSSINGDGGYADVIIIMIVVLLNSVLGVYQESKAEKAIESLQEMTAATTKVIRDGVLQDIKSEDIVIGDIIVLEAGGLRQRQSNCNRHRSGNRDGQNRRRSPKCKGRINSSSKEAQSAFKNIINNSFGHLRIYFCF